MNKTPANEHSPALERRNIDVGNISSGNMASGKIGATFLGQESDDEIIDLRALWQMVFRHRWGIISLSLIVMMLATLLVYNMTPVYESTATLLIEPKEAQVVSIEQIYGLGGSSWQYLPTQFELLKSRALAERVVSELALSRHPEFDPRQQAKPGFSLSAALSSLLKYTPFTQPEDLEEPRTMSEEEISEAIVPALMGRISVAPVLDTQLVKVSVQMRDPVLATTAANAVVNGYINSQLDARMGMTTTAADWMTERLGGLKNNLDASELKLQAYREKENLLDLEGVTRVSADELRLISGSLASARQQRATAESAYLQIQTMKGSGWRSLVTVPAVIANDLVQTFKAEEANAVTKVEELSRRYGEKHPKMQSARSELKTATANLKAQVEVAVSSIERVYQLARSSEGSLISSVKTNKNEIQDIKRKEFKLRELQREVDANRTLYNTFLTRLKETAATTDIDTANARVVDLAVVPRASIKPRKKRIILLSGVLSLMLGVGLALLLEVLNNTFKSADDIENQLQLPVLGILPLSTDKSREVVAKLATENTDKPFTESVRSLRTSVVLSGLDKAHKVILVTSSVPQEGKSSTASNLAFSLGQIERVVLVDADMRKPSIARSLGFPPGSRGLANLVAGTADLKECIQSIDGVDVIPAGMVPPNPLELLSSSKFSSLIAQLGERYDRVVIDSPPVQAVSDALVLSTMASAVVYVLKFDDTSIPVAKKGLGQLLQNNAPVLGVVLNQVDISKAKKYGYDYAGYYDHYGYTDGANGADV